MGKEGWKKILMEGWNMIMNHKFNLGNKVICGVIKMEAQIQSIKFIYNANEPRYEIMYRDTQAKVWYSWYSESEILLSSVEK